MKDVILTRSQSIALQHIENSARQLQSTGLVELPNVLAMSNISEELFESAEREISQHARVGLQFHPDRISKTGKPVAESLLEDGLYKNQFETHLSNGKLDPAADGVRAGWEDSVFGGAFGAQSSDLSERPKYGALNLMLHPDGPCPRFGSCYLLLKPAVSHRSTFTYMDSHRDPLEKGTMKVFEPVFSALLTECFERRFALGRHSISTSELMEHLLVQLRMPFEDIVGLPQGRNLNHYIEAQVQGEISLIRDADVLVADPSFKGSSIEGVFQRLCEKFEIELFWHGGFKMEPDKVPGDFRGPTMRSLAQRISGGGFVDAHLIGEAAADLENNPSSWADRGPYEVVLQELKCLWHVLVQFGAQESGS